MFHSEGRLTGLPLHSTGGGAAILLASGQVCSAAFPLRMMNSYADVTRSAGPR